MTERVVRRAASGMAPWDPYWRQRAACTGEPGAAHFAPADSAEHARALWLCRSCPVRTECLAFALDARVFHGVFGGTVPRWRRELLARRPHVRSWAVLLACARAAHVRR